tara:strand:- start:929 stop:1495 length:567 start_codon:yes stop_codon:yes gene_type:complete
MKFAELLRKTHFVKKFTNKKPKVELIIEAIQVANEGPIAGNVQPLQFVIVEDRELIAMIAAACQQSFITRAPYVIIITSDPTRMRKIYDERSEKYTKQNVGAAMQNITLQLADSGISSSLVAPFSDPTIHNKLKIPDGKEIEIIIAAGEGMEKARLRKRPDLIHKVYYDTWGNRWHGGGHPQVSRRDM